MPHKGKKFTNHCHERSFPAVRTDLAAELDLSDRDGVDERTETLSGFRVSTIRIRTRAASERLGKPVGEYITTDIGKIWLEGDERIAAAAGVIAGKLARLAEEICGEVPERILIAGLGNRHITADALGDEVVGMITVTRHVKAHRELFGLLGGREISAIAPGVLGETGIETAKLVAGAVRAAKPQIVVAVDALAARSTDRLATTVQLGSSGISPGSGIGGRRLAINEETLGVPVIALGVPTVVDSSTLVTDALEKAGMTGIPEELRHVLESGRSFFVTPKETDTIIKELAELSARAITLAFSG